MIQISERGGVVHGVCGQDRGGSIFNSLSISLVYVHGGSSWYLTLSRVIRMHSQLDYMLEGAEDHHEVTTTGDQEASTTSSLSPSNITPLVKVTSLNILEEAGLVSVFAVLGCLFRISKIFPSITQPAP